MPRGFQEQGAETPRGSQKQGAERHRSSQERWHREAPKLPGAGGTEGWAATEGRRGLPGGEERPGAQPTGPGLETRPHPSPTNHPGGRRGVSRETLASAGVSIHRSRGAHDRPEALRASLVPEATLLGPALLRLPTKPGHPPHRGTRPWTCSTSTEPARRAEHQARPRRREHALVRGREVLIRGREALVRGREALVRGCEALVRPPRGHWPSHRHHVDLTPRLTTSRGRRRALRRERFRADVPRETLRVLSSLVLRPPSTRSNSSKIRPRTSAFHAFPRLGICRPPRRLPSPRGIERSHVGIRSPKPFVATRTG